MAKFESGKAVENLEYDFSDHAGPRGVIPEPETGRVREYFKGVRGVMNQAREMRGLADTDVANLSDEETAEVLGKVDEAMDGMEAIQVDLVKWLAFLCGGEWCDPDDSHTEPWVEGGSPSYFDLDGLPFRVQQKFNQWLMQEIQPKRTTPGTRR